MSDFDLSLKPSMKNILAIDTSGDVCSVALKLVGISGDEIVERYDPEPREHSKKLLPMVEQVLAEAGIKLQQLDGIAYVHGPGSFTGLRIGIGVVQGLAAGVDIPTQGVSSLQCLVASAAAKYQIAPQQHVLALLDARMSELYWGLYHTTELAPQAVFADAVTAPNSLPDLDDIEEIIGVGAGWCYRTELPETLQSKLVNIYEQHTSRASDVFSVMSEQGFNEDMAEPVYVRDTVSWKKLSEQ